MTLADLKPGQKATVSGFSDITPMVQRIMQLGVMEGSELLVVRQAPGGDPIEIKVMGYSLSLRKSEASLVNIKDRQ